MKRLIFIAILVMGFSGLVAEILLLRELLIVYSGNELSIGVILANWLILEAIGSFYLGGKAETAKNRLETFTVYTVLFSLSLPAAALMIRGLKWIMGVSLGEGVGFLSMFGSSFLILLPVSILHGALFTYGCRIYSSFSNQEESSAGRVYVYETIGTIFGGIVCAYFLIPYLNTFQAFLWLAFLNVAVCLALLVPGRRKGFQRRSLPVVLVALALVLFCSAVGGPAEKLHQFTIERQWKNLNVVHYQNSQYGNICVIENQGQFVFFQDGVPGLITPVPDPGFVEEFVHLPLLTHPHPEKLLILSGGAGGMINEALKHPSVMTIEYAELDPLLLDLVRRFSTPLTDSELDNQKVRIKTIDGRLYLKTTPQKHDLILIGIAEPSDLQANRFFTREFLTLAKDRLNEDGILALSTPGSLTFANQELKNLNGCLYSTLKSVFPYLRVIPGDGKNIYFASDSRDISTIDKAQVAERLIRRNIEPEVMVPWQIENKLHHGWQLWFDRFIEGSSRKINSDVKPMGLFYSISHWNALYAPSLRWFFKHAEKLNLWVIALTFSCFLALFLALRPRIKRLSRAMVPYSIMTTGFAGMIFDLTLIFTFQSIYGYVFSWIGLLVSFFMAGAAFGALFAIKISLRIKNHLRVFLGIELAIVCFSFGWPFLFLISRSHLDTPGAYMMFRVMILVVSFICGLLTGSQFPLANTIRLRDSTDISRTAGLLYAADLLGGWFGGILGGVVLFPVLGFAGTCFTVGLLKLTSLIAMATQPQGIRGR